MIRPPVERRVTPWRALWFDNPQHTHVRIWQEFDGVRWWQMHEWLRPDGTSDADQGWIIGARGWSKNAEPATGPAPGDPPALDASDIGYLLERLAMVNDPQGQAIRSKLEAMR